MFYAPTVFATHTERPTLTPAEVARLLASAPSIRDKIMLSLIVGTSLRTHDVLALRWMDLDLDRQILRPSGAAIPIAARALLLRRAASARPGDYVLAVPGPRRHASPKDVNAAVERARVLAQLDRGVSTNSLEALDVRWSPTRPLLPTSTFRFARAPGFSAVMPDKTMRVDVNVRPPNTHGYQTAVIEVRTAHQSVALEGAVVGPPDISITIPPAESWRLSLSRLSPDERRRVETPAFYRLVIGEVARRHRRDWWRTVPSMLGERSRGA